MLAALLFAAACVGEPTAELFLELFWLPPPTTSADSVSVGGKVARVPPREGRTYVVTIEGGAGTVSLETLSGLFMVPVPLRPNVENVLLVFATDVGGLVSDTSEVRVVHEEAALPAPRRRRAPLTEREDA